MKLLNQQQIRQKIKRLAFQILEQNLEENEIILAGINNNGTAFAQLIYEQLIELTKIKITLVQVRLSPANPLESEIKLGLPTEEVNDKVIIIVDDVANTGRTIFYAMKPLFNILPKKVEVAVLVDRQHKSFPIRVDYVGLSLATTLQEDIQVNLKGVKEAEVLLN
ncbi:MAG: phosphoribosyltransferase family protein [Bacteroidota bacterium]